MHLGFGVEEIAKMDYIDAVLASWTHFHLRMANSGLFLGNRDEIRIIPYGKETLEQVVRDYRTRLGNANAEPEPVLIHDKARRHADWMPRGDAAVETVRRAWAALGLRFPDLAE
jgi:hypothetical protein